MQIRAWTIEQHNQIVNSAKNRLTYDEGTGYSIWRYTPPQMRRFIGQRAGGISHGRRVISLDNVKFYSTHLIWCIVYDRLPLPGHIIIHKNGDTTDDRLENLEEISLSEQYKRQHRMKEENWYRENGIATPVYHH